MKSPLELNSISTVGSRAAWARRLVTASLLVGTVVSTSIATPVTVGAQDADAGAASTDGTSSTGTSSTGTTTTGGTTTDGTSSTGTTTDGTTGSNGTVTTAPTSGLVEAPSGTGAADAVLPPGAPPNPWANTVDVRVPAFLDTADRRIRDDRPPPSAEQIAALRELEAEVGRFTRAGNSYRGAIVSILRREYAQRRRDREQGYARQIRAEERLQNEARQRAIRLFEQFIRRYPDDPTYTPDAMFRLGELYYERSAIDFQDASDAGTDTLGHPDFTATIDLYRTLVQHFPQYRRIDGVYYLIGYCLNEMGEMEEARLAWLNLVCANHFQYTGQRAAPPTEAPAEDPSVAHPALALDPAAAALPTVYTDPYAECQPIRSDIGFTAETWLRIGEYHFDFDFTPDGHALDRAISAYGQVLAATQPTDRNHSLALYKLAWAYYRASRYPEALARFAELIDLSDAEAARTGRAGSDLRPEAVQYMGIAFAYDDWNENQLPDANEGLPSAIARLQDASLLPQDRPWTAEVYFQTGQVFFDEAKYDLAIQVWELALQRFPQHLRAPEILNQIARAYRRQNDLEQEVASIERISNYGPDSEWYQTHADHPNELRHAEELAEAALIQQAYRHHQTAVALRRRCVENRDVALCDQALAEYRVAADAYRGYIQRYPNSPNAYDLQYNLADALYWSEQYEDAASAYASVRDSNVDDRYLSEAARRVVESLKRILDAAVERGEVIVRSEPPAPEGTPPVVRPLEMPELVRRIAQAREVYLSRVPAPQDTEHVRDTYDYNNAIYLYVYGYYDQARDRFRRIYLEHCSGPNASPEGQVAWQNLNAMAVQANDLDEVERLAQDLLRRSCTFSPDGSAAQVDCQAPANRDLPQCLAGIQLGNARYRRALDIYNQGERATGAEQVRLFEQAATMLVEAVNAEPGHDQAPRALFVAAQALERTGRNDSAGRLYQRIIDEVGPRRAANAEEQAQLDGILSESYFRLAYSANRNFDYDRAIQNYRVLADSDRFARSTDPQMAERRTDALVNAARIFEYQQDYPRAAEYYRRVAEDSRQNAEDRRNAYFRLAEMSFRRRDWAGTVRDMQAFIDRYRTDAAAGELVVLAGWRIAQARLEARQTRDYRPALQNVVTLFERSGQQPSSIAAEYAANARFVLVDDAITPFESFAITPGRPATLEAYVNTLSTQIEAGSRQAQTIVEGYAPVLPYRRPVWSIAAYVRQGRVYEILARAILNAPFVMPDDLARRIRSADEATREEVRVQVEDRVRQTLDPRVRPIECFAVARYALAARAARAGSLDNEYTRIAIDRLQAYGDERIAECIAQTQQTDSTFQAYTPGEFVRARRGRTVAMEPNQAAPALAPEE